MSIARNFSKIVINSNGQVLENGIADSAVSSNKLAASSITRPKIGFSGGVLQVASNTNDTSFNISSSATAQLYYQLNTSVTFTTSSTNSRFLIFGSAPGYCDGNNAGVALGFFFNSTLLVGVNGGSGNSWSMFGNTVANAGSFNLNHHTLHSPNLSSGSSVTVSLAGAAWSRGSGQGNIFFNYNNNTSGAASLYNVRSSITVLELQA